ncbi:polysaccharide lyase family 1 protein [Mangrovibacterium sp.]|uniref:pectate lyase family protein n=1 Tax=Mangrovibacterium sp. TaxID=1961364 RepID=UPI003569076E
MKTLQKYVLLAVLSLSSMTLAAQQLAFPGAMGYGAYAQGGRGGKVIAVTNLNDSGPGSLRAAVEAEGARTVVFKVSGNIALKSMLTITNPFITIAGQTAPGDGICLKDYPLHITGAHDVIVRFIRVRPGIASGLNGSEIDGIEVRDSKNVIVDHCTINWTVDECLNTWHGTENITVQWCLVAEPLNKSVHEKGAHGFTASLGGQKASYLFNLFASGVGRNPSIGGNHLEHTQNVDFSNNVVFNYGNRTCDGKPISLNFTGNYYKPGPATQDIVKKRLVKIDNAQKYGFDGRWYIAGNVIHGSQDVNRNNIEFGVEFEDGCDADNNLLKEPLPVLETKHVSAEKAFSLVLDNAGVTVPGRDSKEQQIIDNASGKLAVIGNGIVNTIEEAGGWPELKSTPAPEDTDEDGMPNSWELAKGLDPKNPDDSSALTKSGFTNLEVYLSQLAGVVGF